MLLKAINIVNKNILLGFLCGSSEIGTIQPKKASQKLSIKNYSTVPFYLGEVNTFVPYYQIWNIFNKHKILDTWHKASSGPEEHVSSTCNINKIIKMWYRYISMNHIQSGLFYVVMRSNARTRLPYPVQGS